MNKFTCPACMVNIWTLKPTPTPATRGKHHQNGATINLNIGWRRDEIKTFLNLLLLILRTTRPSTTALGGHITIPTGRRENPTGRREGPTNPTGMRRGPTWRRYGPTNPTGRMRGPTTNPSGRKGGPTTNPSGRKGVPTTNPRGRKGGPTTTPTGKRDNSEGGCRGGGRTASTNAAAAAATSRSCSGPPLMGS